MLRLTPDRRLSTVVTLDRLSPGGLAFHRDGRLFVAALDIPNGVGAIMAVNLDGSGLEAIIPPEAGYMPNDLVFDAKGGFYFTDFKATATDQRGGVYYTAPDLNTIAPVLPHLAMANGIALSPDGQLGQLGHELVLKNCIGYLTRWSLLSAMMPIPAADLNGRIVAGDEPGLGEMAHLQIRSSGAPGPAILVSTQPGSTALLNTSGHRRSTAKASAAT